MSTSDCRPIAFFDIVDLYGGSRHVTVGLAAEFARTGQPVVVLDAHGQCPEYLQALADAGVPTRVLDADADRCGVGRAGLARVLRLAVRMPHFCKLIRRLRAVVHQLRPRVLVVNACSSLLAAKLAVGAAVPIAYYVLGEYQRLPWYGARYWRQVDLMLGLSQRCLDRALALVPTIHRTGIAFNGLNIEATRCAAQQPIPAPPGADRAFKLVFPGSIVPLKGQETAIRAVARLRDAGVDVHLWLAGAVISLEPTGYVHRLRRLIADLTLENRVSLLDWHENILALMARSDAVILTSCTEGVPCSLMEAMALGKPVLATRVGGIPELVRDGIDGHLVDVGDVEQTYMGLTRLLDPAVRARVGQDARVRMEQNFTVAHQAAAVLSHLRPLWR